MIPLICIQKGIILSEEVGGDDIGAFQLPDYKRYELQDLSFPAASICKAYNSDA